MADSNMCKAASKARRRKFRSFLPEQFIQFHQQQGRCPLRYWLRILLHLASCLDHHAVLPAAQAQGMGIIIGSPLQQGALARRYEDEVRHGARWLSPARRAQYIALYDFLDEINIPLPELALRFVISNPNISTTLMGARSREEVEQNVASVEKGPLPEDILKRLDDIAAMVPFRPFEEPFGLPFTRPYYGPGIAR